MGRDGGDDGALPAMAPKPDRDRRQRGDVHDDEHRIEALRAWLIEQGNAVRALRGTRAERESLLGVGFVVLVTALHVINALWIEGELLNFSGDWTFSGDWNVPTFATALVFFLAGGSCLRTARFIEDPERRAWMAIAAVVLLLGVEAIVNLHGEAEAIGNLRVAVMIAMPVIGGTLIFLVSKPLMALRAPAPLLLISGALLLVATQAVAALTGSTEIAGPAKRAFSIFQEGGEMLSACFVLGAAGAALDGGHRVGVDGSRPASVRSPGRRRPDRRRTA